MLVEAENLTRYYGAFLAVDHISFSIDRGEIVGLLGPNGAGKTTTMRMATGFLPANEGSVEIAGYDVRTNPRAARRHIGYMPENNPLYTEMRTREYLGFRAALKGVARRERNRRISECIDLCAIRDVEDQIVGTLSKGYRQRVGLADAMLAEPDVLILDEPTIGLDPNQVRETRRLVGDLGENHTVLISTHILAEVEAICERVLIIDKGRIVADDSPQALSERLMRGSVTAELHGNPEEIKAGLEGLNAVEEVLLVEADEWSTFNVFPKAGVDVREGVFRLAAERGWSLRELTRGRASLEDVFHRITLGSGSQPTEHAEPEEES